MCKIYHGFNILPKNTCHVCDFAETVLLTFRILIRKFAKISWIKSLKFKVKMEVLNKFKSQLQSSVSSTVFSTVSTIRDVLPGNPVNRDFEVGEHIASAGPGLFNIWTIKNDSNEL